MIVEVTSESTGLSDRTTKLGACKRMPSVQEVLIIDQHQVRIEHHTRMVNGWFVQEFSDLAETITLESLGCVLAMGEAYAKVTFPEYRQSPAASSSRYR